MSAEMFALSALRRGAAAETTTSWLTEPTESVMSWWALTPAERDSSLLVGLETGKLDLENVVSGGQKSKVIGPGVGGSVASHNATLGAGECDFSTGDDTSGSICDCAADCGGERLGLGGESVDSNHAQGEHHYRRK
jgi:hypothetical protein